MKQKTIDSLKKQIIEFEKSLDLLKDSIKKFNKEDFEKNKKNSLELNSKVKDLLKWLKNIKKSFLFSNKKNQL